MNIKGREGVGEGGGMGGRGEGRGDGSRTLNIFSPNVIQTLWVCVCVYISVYV